MNKTYDDFLLFMESNPYKEVIEMDTVIGKKGGKSFTHSLLKKILFDDCNTP